LENLDQVLEDWRRLFEEGGQNIDVLE